MSNNEPCMIWPALVGLNLVELNYYSFIIRGVIMLLSETKDINVNIFNMITRSNEAKTM